MTCTGTTCTFLFKRFFGRSAYFTSFFGLVRTLTAIGLDLAHIKPNKMCLRLLQSEDSIRQIYFSACGFSLYVDYL